NARTDVYLRGLVPRERAVEETIERARRYRAAGCDGIFVPALSDPAAIRSIAAAIALPLNVMVVPRLPPAAELAARGVRRVSGAGRARRGPRERGCRHRAGGVHRRASRGHAVSRRRRLRRDVRGHRRLHGAERPLPACPQLSPRRPRRLARAEIARLAANWSF